MIATATFVPPNFTWKVKQSDTPSEVVAEVKERKAHPTIPSFCGMTVWTTVWMTMEKLWLCLVCLIHI